MNWNEAMAKFFKKQKELDNKLHEIQHNAKSSITKPFYDFGFKKLGKSVKINEKDIEFKN